MSAARILEVDALDFDFVDRAWPFAEAEAERIAEHWRARLAAQPKLYNGRVLLLARHTLVSRPAGAALAGEYIEVDYAAFLAWRDFDFPGPAVANCFAMAALVGADGSFLVGEMAPHTANAGAIYFPAGTPDADDVFAGKVDLEASALRELAEETGVAAGEATVAPDWIVVYAPPRIACMKIVRLAEPADVAKARIESFLAADPEAELSAIHVVRAPGDLDRARAPAFMADFFDYVFAQRSVG